MIGRLVPWLLAVALISACAVDLVSPADPTALIPDRTASIHAGQAQRAAVRAQLGDPPLSSTAWGFDLFRADTEQTDVPVALTPWPVPFARVTDALHRYTLVAYDAQGRATALATGIFRRPAAWRKASPIVRNFAALHLRAGELMFFVNPEGSRRENLLVAPIGRDAFLQRARVSSACTVVLGCGDRGCADTLSVDGEPDRRLALRITDVYWFVQPGERETWLRDVERPGDRAPTPWLEALTAVTLQPGTHELRFSARHLGGSHRVSLACRCGQLAYLVVHATDNGSWLNRALVDWQVDVLESMPERFARRPLVIIEDGRWQVGEEATE